MMLLAPSLFGGFLGSLLVVMLSADSFKTAVPWLILTAALLFALQPRIARWTGIGQASQRLAVVAVRRGGHRPFSFAWRYTADTFAQASES